MRASWSFGFVLALYRQRGFQRWEHRTILISSGCSFRHDDAIERQHRDGYTIDLDRARALILGLEVVQAVGCRHYVEAVAQGPSSDLRGHHSEVSWNEDATSALRRLVDSGVGPIREPEIQIFRHHSGALDDRSGNPYQKVRNAEVAERGQEGPLSLCESEVGLARGIA